MRKMVLIALLTIGFLITPLLARPGVYKWVDEQGTVHFTDDYSTIPEKYKQQLERMSLSEDSKSIMEGTQEDKGHVKPIEQGKTEGKKEEIRSNSPVVQETSFLSGQIIKINNVERMLTVKGKKETIEFTVPEDTRIATDLGKGMLFTTLGKGMLVTVEFFKQGGAIYPVRIKINTVGLNRKTASHLIED